MPDAPGPDIAAQIAHAKRTLSYLEASLGWPQGGSSQNQIDAQNAILRTLEAAQAWQEKHDGPGGTVEEVMPAERELLRAIRGETP